MNKTYRLVWSELAHSWIAVSEITKARGKKSSRALLLTAAVAVLPAPTFAQAPPPATLPNGGQVVAGTASIAQSGATMNITQNTQRAAIDWQTFNVGSAATVNFIQPSSSAVVLNRVLSGNPSQIFGQINANGQVFLSNPGGVYFAPGASVNVGALVATTHRISNADFMAGNYRFSHNGATGSIVNEGNITGDLGGYIALLAPEVRNQGVVIAQAGTVALAAGELIELQMSSNNGLADIRVEAATIAALVENKHAVHAPGGLIILSAQAADRLQGGVVRNSGSLEATGLINDGGTIKLQASDRIDNTGSINVDAAAGKVGAGGTALLIASLDNPVSETSVGGRISARGGDLGGDGGFIETSAAKVSFADGVNITTAAAHGKTGQWLIDPVDFKVAASGGDITGSALGSLLGANSVTIQTATGTDSATEQFGASGTNGDIFVNDAVSWSANNTLTLNAYRNIAINQKITASGATGKLVLQYGQGAVASGNTATYTINAPINLQAGPNFSTKLGSDGTTLDYTVITSLGAAGSTSGTDLQGINGNLTGRYALGADIDASATAGWNSGAGFKPLGDHVTTFRGELQGLGHVISGLTVGPQPGYSWAGGMFGQIDSTGLINQLVLDKVSVSGYRNSGAIAGRNTGTIRASSATGSVSGTDASVGGLVGYHAGGGLISGSHFSGTVAASGSGTAGGLAGENANTTIENSYAIATVSNTFGWAGGLVGYNYGTINTSYAAGTVSSGGNNVVGAMVGGNNAYANINNSYWNSTLAGNVGWSYNNGGLNNVQGVTTANMRKAASFVGFNFTTTPGSNHWVIVNGDGSLNSAGTEGDGTRPMLASEYRTVIRTPEQLQLMALDLSANYTLAANIDASATGNSSSIWGSAGFVPVGNVSTTFTGTLDGLNRSISNLTINRPSTGNVGLFGEVGTGGNVQNVGVVAGSVTGASQVGGLAGSNRGTINNSYATVSVTGSSDDVGGLVGHNHNTVSNSYATGNATSTGGNSVAGLVGFSEGGTTISNSYASGNVSGAGHLGGLVGHINTGTISNSYATGSVTGTSDLVGGLVGYSQASIQNTYSTGSVTGVGTYVGGLIGRNDGGSLTNNFWDASTSGKTAGLGGGATSNEVFALDGTRSPYKLGEYVGSRHTYGTFNGTSWIGFDFANTWYMVDGYTRPFLRMEHSTTITNAHQLQLMNLDLTANYTLGANIDAAAANGTTTPSGMWSSAGFVPIGQGSAPADAFRGQFNGAGHTISNLKINRPDRQSVGLFGAISNATIQNVGLSNVTITGGDYVGALAGFAPNSSISQAFSTGSVAGGRYVGGLVGYSEGSTINNSFSKSTVSGTGEYVGGLVGNAYFGSLDNSYATGSVNGTTSVGGLIGSVDGTAVSNSFWDIQTSGRATSAGGTGKTTAEMQALATFTGWNIANTSGSSAVWRIYEGASTPVLRSLFTPITLTPVYDGTAQTWVNSYDYTANITNLNSANLLTTAAGLTLNSSATAGTHTASLSGFISSVYDISYASRTITGTGSTANNIIIANALTWTGAGNLTINANNIAINGAITANGNLTLTGNGTITQSAAVSVAGTTSITAGAANNITLDNASNNFTGAVSVVSGNNVSLKDANALSLGVSNVSGNLTAEALAGDLTIAGNISKTSGANATATFKASGNVIQNASTAISSSANTLNTVFWADSDATNGGAIVLNSGSSITSNGGNVTLGGGADPATNVAIGNATYTSGILIDRATISAGAGAISLRGTGSGTGGIGVNLTGNTASLAATSGNVTIAGTGAGTGGGRIGVFIGQGAAIRTTGGGDISITGQGSLAGTTTNNEGVKLDGGGLVEIQSGSNRTLTINGTGGTGTSYNIGVNVRGSGSVIRMGAGVTGQMNVTGTGGTCSVTGCWGVLVEDGGVYESLGAAAINFTGTGGTGTDNKGIKYSGGAASRVGSSSMTGDITLTADTMDLVGSSGSLAVQASGALTVKPKTANTTIGIAGGTGTLQLPASNFSSQFANGFSGITVGSTNAGDITIAGTTTYNDPLTFKTTGHITMSASSSLTGATGESAHLTLWADADATGGGAIYVMDGASISSNGGAIVLSGGTDLATGYAQGNGTTDVVRNGVTIGTGSSLNSAGGNITLRGKSSNGSSGSLTYLGGKLSAGVFLKDSTVNAGGGKIVIVGESLATGISNAQGVTMYSNSKVSSSNAASDAIQITGTHSGSTSDWAIGANVYGNATVQNTGGGGITITGTGGTTSGSAQESTGLYLTGNILASSGPITLSGTKGTGGTNSVDIHLEAATIGQKTSSDVASSSSNISVNANTITIPSGARVQSTGALTISPRTAGTTIGIAGGTGTLQLTASHFATNFVNGFSSITVGNANAGNITIAGNTTYNDPLTFKTADNILINASSSLAGATGETAHLRLWADADATSGGAIVLNSGASITSNGGNVTLGGGADPATTGTIGNATYAHGIFIDRATVSSGAGAISLRGTGRNTGGIGVYLDGNAASVASTSGNITISGTGNGAGNGWIGTFIYNGAAIRTTGGGDISITGQGSLASTTTNNEGVKLDGGGLVEIQSGSNRTLTINGTGGTGTSYNIGVNVRGSGSVIRMGAGVTGQMNVTGTGGTCSVTGCWGVLVEDGGVYESLGAAAINFTGTGGTGTDNKGIKYSGGAASRVGSSSMTGDITLTADTMDLVGSSGSLAVQASGALTVKPKTANTTIGIAGGTGTLQLPASNFSSQFADGFASIAIGRSDGTGKITAGAFIPRDNLTLLTGSGGIELTGLLNAGTNTVTLNSTGTVTDSGSGSITATGLALLGTAGNFTLDSTGNVIGTLAANTGSLYFVNASALTIGTVNPTGITATGPVRIETQGGDLLVTESISTSNTSANAIVLNAGKSSAAGTSTGGNIIVTSGKAVTVGAGGTAKLYTGSLSGSTNLATMTGLGSGSGRFRYNADETTNFAAGGWTNLGTGLHAIYREQPSLSITPSTASSSYGSATNLAGVTATVAGYVNGDDASKAGLTGTATFTTTATSSSNAGSYDIAYASGLSSAIGYALSDASASTSEYTINPAALSITANAASKTYDGLAYSGGNGVSYSGFVNGDTSAVLGGTLAYGGSSQGAINAGSYVIAPSGLTAGNYTINFTNGALTVNKANATVTANSSAVTYTGLAQNVTGFSASGLVNGETTAVLTDVSTSGGTGTNAGSYPHTASGTAQNYTLSFVDGSLSINPAALTVTADAKSKTYGATDPALTYAYNGLVGSDTPSVFSGALTRAAGETVVGGPYAISQGTLSAGSNYTISYTGNSLTINPAALSVTANAASKTYDGLAYSGGNGVSYSGFVNNETSAVLGGTLTYGGSSQGAINAGSYVIAPSGLTAGNYTISFANGALTVNKANATVTANSSTVTYTGLAQNVTGFSASGLVNGETTTVLTDVSTSGGTGTNAGSYPHTVSGTAQNYTLSFVDGSLSINPAALTVTANAASKTYDGLAYSGGNGVSYSGFVNNETSAVLGGTLTYGGSSQGAINTGSYVIAPSGLTAGNYTISFTDGALTIAAAQEPPPPPPAQPTPPLPTPDSAPPAPTFAPASTPASSPAAEGSSGGAVTGGMGSASGGVSVSLVRPPSVQETGVIAVSVPKEMATAGVGFTFPLPAQAFAEAAPNAPVQVKLANGGPLPTWLRFVPESKSFVAAAVPDGAFPVQVVVTTGGKSVTIVISERKE